MCNVFFCGNSYPPPHSAVWIIPSRGLSERRECFPSDTEVLLVLIISVRTWVIIFQRDRFNHRCQHYFGLRNKLFFFFVVIFSSRQASLISSVSSLAGVRAVHNAYAAGQHHVPPRRKPAPGPGKSLLQRVSSQLVFLDVSIYLFSYLDLLNCVVWGNTQINN